MTTRTLPRSAPKAATRRQLTEYLRGLDPAQLAQGESRVDRQACVIKGVRICGLVSDNGRKYPPEVLKKAIPLYEGCKVRISHKRGERVITETFGWVANVRQDPSGILRGDLHYLKTHALAEMVCEAADRNPSLWGLSHDIDADTRTDEDGSLTITEILEARSVDLVDSPATGSGLFESKHPMKITLRKILEASKLPAEQKTKLLEMGAACGEVMNKEYEAAPVPVEDETPEEPDWKEHLVNAIKALCDEGTPEAHAKCQKIMALLKPESAEEEEEEEPAAKKPDEEEEPEKKESLQLKADLNRLTETNSLRDQLDDAGLTFASAASRNTFIKSLLPLSATERKSLIEERKGATPGVKRGVLSRTPAPTKTPVQEAAEQTKTAEDVTDLVAELVS